MKILSGDPIPKTRVGGKKIARAGQDPLQGAAFWQPRNTPSFVSWGEFGPPALRSIFLSQISCQVALFLRVSASLLRETKGQKLFTYSCEKATSAP